jgi:branched-chain amino acid transport system substrate-binding protein
MAIAITIFAVACGGSTTATTKVAQGVTKDTILVGGNVMLTGAAPVAGAGFKGGLDAAIAEINAKGGINGRKFKLNMLDNGFEAARSVANMRRLGDDDKVYAIVVPAGSAILPGSWPYVKQSGIPVWAPTLPPDPNLPSVFMMSTSHTDQAKVLVDFLKSKNVNTLGYVGQDNDLGQSLLDGVNVQVPKAGMKLVATEKTQAGSPNVAAAVNNLFKAKPDAVMIGTDNTQAGLIIKQSKALGFNPIFVGDSTTASTGSAGVTSVAGDAADGMYGSAALALPTDTIPELQNYRKAMQQYAPDQIDNAYALQSYSYMQTFFEVIKRQGSDLTWTNFTKVAESLKGVKTGLLPPVNCGPLPGGHTCTQGAKISQFTNKKWTTITPDWLQPK